MPPKPTYTREDVVASALQVVRRTGLAGLSAREVAAALGSSTAPVYHLFDSMNDLEETLLKRIRDMALENMTIPYTDRHFLNIGIGFATFARDEPLLFRALHLDNTKHRRFIDELFQSLKDSMTRDSRFAEMSETDRATLLAKMWTFTFGLSIQIAYGLVADTSTQAIERILRDTGTIIIGDALQRMLAVKGRK